MGRAKEFDTDVAVAAAMDLFWEQGYGATTPAQLVDHLGIGRGSLYNAFDNKHGLFQQALRRYVAEQSAMLQQAADGAGTARERVRHILSLVTDQAVGDRRRRGCLITNSAVELAGADADTRREVRAMLRRQEAILGALIQEGQRAGEFDADRDPAEAALHLVTLMNGIQVMARVTPDRQRLRALADAALRTL